MRREARGDAEPERRREFEKNHRVKMADFVRLDSDPCPVPASVTHLSASASPRASLPRASLLDAHQFSAGLHLEAPSAPGNAVSGEGQEPDRDLQEIFPDAQHQRAGPEYSC